MIIDNLGVAMYMPSPFFLYFTAILDRVFFFPFIRKLKLGNYI